MQLGKNHSKATSLSSLMFDGCSVGDTDGGATLHSNADTPHQERECARLSS